MGIRKWAGFGVAVTLIILVLGTFVWWTSRPVALNAAELTPAGEGTSWPGTELSLNLTKYTLELTFVNDSSQAFYHGDPPDYCGLEVQSDGAWYQGAAQGLQHRRRGSSDRAGGAFYLSTEPVPLWDAARWAVPDLLWILEGRDAPC